MGKGKRAKGCFHRCPEENHVTGCPQAHRGRAESAMG